MGRTNIEIDDLLVSTVMSRYGVRTKKEAVDLALRRLVGSELTPDFLVGLRGIGWDGDLAAMRATETAVGQPAAPARPAGRSAGR